MSLRPSDRGHPGSTEARVGLPWWSSGSDSALLLQGAWVQSLFGEVGSCMPLGEREARVWPSCSRLFPGWTHSLGFSFLTYEMAGLHWIISKASVHYQQSGVL